MIAARQAASRTSPSVSLALVTMTLAAALASGCDDSPTTEPRPTSIELHTPDDLLAKTMEQAFDSRDSILVQAMLHEEFTCLALQEDADSLRDILGSDSFCGRALYLQAVGRLFHDLTITGIDLDVVINDNQPSMDESCADCRRMDATLTLRIDKLDDSGDVSFVADAPMTFYVRRDHEQQWVLWKQISRSSSAATTASELVGWFDCCAQERSKQ